MQAQFGPSQLLMISTGRQLSLDLEMVIVPLAAGVPKRQCLWECPLMHIGDGQFFLLMAPLPQHLVLLHIRDCYGW